MALINRELDRAVRRRFVLFDRLGMLDRRGMYLVDPWPLGRSLGMTKEETERALASLAGIGWIARFGREGGERIALTVQGLALR